MNFGIEGLHMYTTEHYHLQETSSKDFQKYRKNMEFAKDVRRERIQRRHFQVEKAKKKES